MIKRPFNKKKWQNRPWYQPYEGACLFANVEPPETEEEFFKEYLKDPEILAAWEMICEEIRSGRLEVHEEAIFHA